MKRQPGPREVARVTHRSGDTITATLIGSTITLTSDTEGKVVGVIPPALVEAAATPFDAVFKLHRSRGLEDVEEFPEIEALGILPKFELCDEKCTTDCAACKGGTVPGSPRHRKEAANGQA